MQVTHISAATRHQFWAPHVERDLEAQNWSITDMSHQIDLAAWQRYLDDLPRDPYVNDRWKRMAWLNITDDGDIADMGECPMAQGGMFNDADSMADKLRYYPALERSFIERDDVQAFVRAWTELWGISPREPILMQITGVKGTGQLDPLQGQGIHADGSQFLSIMVLNRENVRGGDSCLYADKAGTQLLARQVLEPGEVLHLRDDRLYHGANGLEQEDPDQPFERFIIIINCRFVDGFQNRMLRRHFPHAVINEVS
ncbi:2OG-Fe dioxygenase family protein [Kushneria phosphatilytica]|uniref:2OG-Fe dioxygenase family protein n=1 Tax=Kushneria phosphatilytica TaxID=657387 RepID=A0A5C0ZY65_9GAMM|nr:2OG-Fe dioxygenase family protein [Kushneria phosphatilytica]QEL10617.1 2OG-Fe dioxygenase family protein [Kushneria phosphatilytica]